MPNMTDALYAKFGKEMGRHERIIRQVREAGWHKQPDPKPVSEEEMRAFRKRLNDDRS